MRLVRLSLAIASASIAIAAVACSGELDSAFGDSSNRPNTGPEDAGSFSDVPSADAGSVLQQDAVLLVHAANAPAFRLCFESAPDIQPLPDSTLKPASNVVGVEVGSAVRVGKIPHGIDKTDGDGGTIGNRVWFFSEPLIRPLYGAGGKAPSCGALLESAPAFAVLLGSVGDLSRGIHILAVTGCAASSAQVLRTKAECGEDYTGASTLAITEVSLDAMPRQSTAVLPAQLIDLSKPLELARGTRPLRIAYGDLTLPESASAQLVPLAEAPSLGKVTPTPPMTFSLPTNAADFETNGFRISYVDLADGGMTTVADQSLATINRISAPAELPSNYYTAGSSYLFMLIGSPVPANPDGGGVDPDELRNVHMLAVPVYVPDFDAGPPADAGTDTDAGDASTTP